MSKMTYLWISGVFFQALNTQKCCFRSKCPTVLTKAYVTFVRPLLEYGSQIWSPRLQKDVYNIERIQCCFTKRFPGMGSLSYSDRLGHLNLESLESRRVKADLVLLFKVIHGFVDIDCNAMFDIQTDWTTRGHDLHIRKHHSNIDARGRPNFVFFFLFRYQKKHVFYFSAFYFSAEKDIRIFVSFPFSVQKWP